jgi:hydroxymethylbilane synthase
VRIVLLRGNVDTRVRKVMEDGEAEAAVLAVAGLKRLDLEHVIAEYFDPAAVLPAIGQGFLAIEARAQDAEALALARSAEDREARCCADAERAFLAAVGAGCKAAAAAYATMQDGILTMDGMIAGVNGRRVLQERVQGDLSAQEAGVLLKERLWARGAGKIAAEEERPGG